MIALLAVPAVVIVVALLVIVAPALIGRPKATVDPHFVRLEDRPMGASYRILFQYGYRGRKSEAELKALLDAHRDSLCSEADYRKFAKSIR